jgi:putative lipoic acid-binding regulatory protein
MKTPTDPTGLMLVGFLLICILMLPAAASGLPSSQEQLNKVIDQHQKSPLGVLKVGAETISFPWFGLEDRRVYPNLPASTPDAAKKEEILMDSSHPTANVHDISANNRQIQRDVIFKDSQKADPDDKIPANRQEISVSGTDEDEYEDRSAEIQRQENGRSGQNPNEKWDNAGNYLSINVHDISVSAINTMDGGSAVANSNIIINPVQIIVRSPEVGIKL